MGIYRALGPVLVTESEYRERLVDGSLEKFQEGLKARMEARLSLAGGEVRSADVKVGFEPVGPGLPLTVMIRHLYTGAHPKGLFDKTKDMLVISAMKGIEVYSGSPRAVNFLKKQVGQNEAVAFAAATEEGTPLVFYSPALTQTDSVVSFEVVFDKFPKEAFEKVSSVFQGLSGIPAFTPSSGILLAAGLLTRLVGKVGEAIFDGDPVFRATEPITFTLPGASAAIADFRLVWDDAYGPLPANHGLSNGKLVDLVTGKVYQGDVPYMVISLDGGKHDEYANFVPTAATASLLERFYRSQSTGSVGLEAFVEAVKLYNDVRFRRRAETLKKEIGLLAAGDAKNKKIVEYNALVRNILSEELKIGELKSND